MTDDNLNPNLKETLDSHIDWIHQVTERAAADNWQAVQKAINDLEDEQLRGMIYVLVLARGNDSKHMQDLVANWRAAPTN